MPEARDRLTRPNEVVTEIYIPRQTPIGRIRILPDTEMSINLTPFRWGATPLTGGGSSQHTGEALYTTRRGVSGRPLFETPIRQRENTPPSANSSRRGRGRSGRSVLHSVLPSDYPRTPLRDITAVVRAIERRRARLGEGVGLILGSPVPVRMDHQPADQDHSPSDAHLENDTSFVTPKLKLGAKSCKQSTLGRVPLMLAAIGNQCEEESEVQTPQKRLLNSIEVVNKVVMEELHRLKRTPAAKKAERERIIRTLMSMR